MYQIYLHINDGDVEIRNGEISKKYVLRRNAEREMRRLELNDEIFWETEVVSCLDNIERIVHVTPCRHGRNGKQIENYYKWYSVNWVK